MIFGRKNKQSTASLTPHPGSPDRQSAENTRILTILAQDYLKEKKYRRRWGMFIKLLVIAYIAVTTFAYFKTTSTVVSDEHTAIVELNGVIGPDALTADKVNRSLRNAFESEASVGVVLRINSPGGTPVQAAQINEEIWRLKEQYPDKPFYAAVTDICASGGYYIAVAADEIFAHPSSIVGSIGVLMNGFGFTESMKKLGIERRLITSGENKAILDPFSPVVLSDQRHAQSMLDDVHQQFIAAVRKGRGDRLGNDPDIFSGLFWSGEKAKQLGLVDQFGTAELIARDILGAEKLVDYTIKPSLLDLFAGEIGASISNTLLQSTISIR
jgi:protease-4